MRFSTQNPEGFLELDLFEDVFVVVAETEDGETKLLLLLKEKSKKIMIIIRVMTLDPVHTY